MSEKRNLAEIKKAAEWFENRAKTTPMPGARRMFELAAEALREKSDGVTAHEWISVDERLPVDGCCVYVCDDYGLMGEAYYCGGGRFEWGDSEDMETAYATHWMPLPEAPKGE